MKNSIQTIVIALTALFIAVGCKGVRQPCGRCGGGGGPGLARRGVDQIAGAHGIGGINDEDNLIGLQNPLQIQLQNELLRRNGLGPIGGLNDGGLNALNGGLGGVQVIDPSTGINAGASTAIGGLGGINNGFGIGGGIGLVAAPVVPQGRGGIIGSPVAGAQPGNGESGDPLIAQPGAGSVSGPTSSIRNRAPSQRPSSF